MKRMLIATMLSFIILATLIIVYFIRFKDGYRMPLPETPKSLLELRARDVKVIAAIGDSITAGFAAKGLLPNQVLDLNALVEDRGLSFSIGGDQGAITLGNFFAKENPSIFGRSVGSHAPNICTPLFCIGSYQPELDQLNGARTGATTSNINNQVTYIVEQMKNTSLVNFENDPKLISVMIGANDICRSCRNLLTPDQFEENMKSLFEKIRLQIPNTIINAYQLFNVSQLYDLTKDSTVCQEKRASSLTSECRCAFDQGPEGDLKRTKMDELTVEYNKKLLKIATEYKQMNSSSFMVIVDPAASGFALKNVTIDYLSNTDCFHPSKKAHELFAKYAWHNLFLPFSEKKAITSLSIESFQPTNDSLIRGL
jgi:phospholipase B1